MVFVRPENIPLEQRRGIESIDLNIVIVLVRAPVNSVAQALSQSRQPFLWERDAYEREVEIIGHSFIVFQLRGHPWSLLFEFRFLRFRVPLGAEDAQILSRLLNTRSIYYLASDTAGIFEYHVYDRGRAVERLFFEEEYSFQFESELRQLEARDIEDAYIFTFDFMCEQDAYIPALFRPTNLSDGQRITLRLENLAPDDIERMDYIAQT